MGSSTSILYKNPCYKFKYDKMYIEERRYTVYTKARFIQLLYYGLGNSVNVVTPEFIFEKLIYDNFTNSYLAIYNKVPIYLWLQNKSQYLKYEHDLITKPSIKLCYNFSCFLKNVEISEKEISENKYIKQSFNVKDSSISESGFDITKDGFKPSFVKDDTVDL